MGNTEGRRAEYEARRETTKISQRREDLEGLLARYLLAESYSEARHDQTDAAGEPPTPVSDRVEVQEDGLRIGSTGTKG